jgi:quercetin dioxygenase-like cupin family protein
MQIFDFNALCNDAQTYSEPYHEFLRSPNASAGVYHLEVGQHDPQGKHQEDVLFCVVRGAGGIKVDDTDISVQTGSIVFVPAHAWARFVDVTEPLDVLVVIAPAETTPTLEYRPNAG